MRLTRRGRGAIVVVAVAIAMAWLSGPRSLNAIAAPLLIAIGAGAVQVCRAGAPTVERSQPRRGFPGERRTITLHVDGSTVATITDRIGDDLSGSARFERTLPATVSYEVTYERRGVHTIGRTTVALRDVLGLVEREYQVFEQTEIVVYPAVYSLGTADAFDRTLGPESEERTEFDRLREYVPGDSLRDVHWKSSAKYDDLLVTEFRDPVDDEGVVVAARCAEGYADEMAIAAATVLVGASRAGLTTELVVPTGRIPAGNGQTHRQQALELLARTRSGTVRDDVWDEADIRIDADRRGTSVTIGETAHDLRDLTAARDNPLLVEGPA